MGAGHKRLNERDPTKPDSARHLLETLAWTPENVLRIGRAYLEDPAYGDIPESVHRGFSMGLNSEDADRVLPQLVDMRVEHFARLGRQAPEYGKYTR